MFSKTIVGLRKPSQQVQVYHFMTPSGVLTRRKALVLGMAKRLRILEKLNLLGQADTKLLH
jgi:hypothetical protein